ncbi:undecaprenyl-diphosphatase [Candidatus Levyibacteriota bacterium]|nr:undecaprenyl-diphosphatase [Candidatus Levybacteria bacterium]
MNLIEAVIFSIVEGITEFLPVSSTGHLNLVRVLLNIPKTDFFTTFEIFIQLGSILAVIFLYGNIVLKNKEYWKKIITAFIPTAIIGLTFGKFIKNYLISNEYITLIALFLGGIILIFFEIFYKEKDHHIERIELITYPQAAIIGIFQSLAMIPGVSRSASTILGALFLGTKRNTAIEFSFLLAIPTMIAAAIFSIKDADFNFSTNESLLMMVGILVSFIMAIFTIKWLVNFIKSNSFIPFGIYRIIISIIFYIFILN